VLVVLAPPVGWQPSASGYRVLRHPDEPQVLVLAGVELRRIRAPHVTLRSSSLLFEVELGGRPVTVLAAHLVAPRSPSEEGVRDGQLRTLGRWARGHVGPEIVLGDMNATPWSSAIADLEEAAELRNSAQGFGFQATWPASLGSFGVPIDQLLHSAELTVVDRDVGPSFGSDHRSLWATVALAASP
jgi:endonuclease/exonuclease/phosphatase (EEP) superfamily protein YafD